MGSGDSMKQEIFDPQNQKVPIKMWTDAVEDQAAQQLKNIASLPFVFKHVAAMPDVHLGIGATVGSVIALKNAVIPAAVGVDIGCGMMAVQLQADLGRAQDSAKKIRQSIERSVPVGFDQNKTVSDEVGRWPGWARWNSLHAPPSRGQAELRDKAQRQLCSLGGGNHFIELCADTAGGLWVMLHSGSRGIGNQIARVHMERAKGMMKQMLIRLPDPDLAYFTTQTPEYSEYMADLMWCQDYARENREQMMGRIIKDISYALGLGGAPLKRLREVNCHHNYAAMETHFGEEVLVTRKGAVRAREGDFGIIPGSMGTRSYIVEGLGNPDSFHSCSHGAGRRMSRTLARKTFSVQDLLDQTKGVDCRKDPGVLDEIPGAYKDIDVVMENQKDLVRVVAQLKQFLCVKG